MRGGQSSVRGFTLVELLVGLVVLSLIMLGLLAALRGFAATGERLDQRLRRDDDLRIATDFLRGLLASAAPLRQPGSAQKELFFFGRESELVWVGSMPARHGLGGLHYLHLSIAHAPGRGAGLELRYQPWRGEVPPTDWTQIPVGAVLYRGVDWLQLRYQDPKAVPGAQWSAEWTHVDRLPARISLSTGAGTVQLLPPLVVPVLAPAPGSALAPGSDEFSFGGTGR